MNSNKCIYITIHSQTNSLNQKKYAYYIFLIMWVEIPLSLFGYILAAIDDVYLQVHSTMARRWGEYSSSACLCCVSLPPFILCEIRRGASRTLPILSVCCRHCSIFSVSTAVAVVIQITYTVNLPPHYNYSTFVTFIRF